MLRYMYFTMNSTFTQNKWSIFHSCTLHKYTSPVISMLMYYHIFHEFSDWILKTKLLVNVSSIHSLQISLTDACFQCKEIWTRQQHFWTCNHLNTCTLGTLQSKTVYMQHIKLFWKWIVGNLVDRIKHDYGTLTSKIESKHLSRKFYPNQLTLQSNSVIVDGLKKMIENIGLQFPKWFSIHLLSFEYGKWIMSLWFQISTVHLITKICILIVWYMWNICEMASLICIIFREIFIWWT